jgi:hypothetical protein
MKKIATRVLLGVVLSVALPCAAGAQTLLFDYLGFDYESPDPLTGQFGEVGSGYVGLGTVPGLFAPLVADTANNEYTYVINGLTPVAITPVGPFVIIDYSVGTLSIYEDSKTTGTAADYGTNPPSAVAPVSFTDGTLFVTGPLTNFQFILNTSNGSGSFESQFAVTGGTQLPNFPLGQTTGWTFAGATGNALNIPAGYAHQIDGQTFLAKPVPTRNVSWGRVKSLYR